MIMFATRIFEFLLNYLSQYFVLELDMNVLTYVSLYSTQ